MSSNPQPLPTALLVDDSTFARTIGKRVLTTVGFTAIMEAASGKEAMDILKGKEHGIGIVFCDLVMPDMDGVQFIRYAADLPESPEIIFVSGAESSLLQTAEDTARARGMRVLGTIQKPLTPDAVTRLLARRRPEPLAGTGARRAFNITVKDIDAGLAADQFVLHFQPKVSLADGALVGFESLVRWDHPDHGMIPPDAFIALAEENGRISALTDRITMLALRQSSAWAKAGFAAKISVNLSAYMLVDLDLPDRMAREAQRCTINPKQLVLEITESGLFQDAANTLEILARLHMKGFPLSIDDFGTGYSSMEQLRRVPFAEMKIDRAFVRGAAENAKARAILESSVNLGHSLRLTVVAEGAETQEDWDILKKTGVDVVQGYFVAKPMPAGQVIDWAQSRGRKK